MSFQRDSENFWQHQTKQAQNRSWEAYQSYAREHMILDQQKYLSQPILLPIEEKDKKFHNFFEKPENTWRKKWFLMFILTWIFFLTSLPEEESWNLERVFISFLLMLMINSNIYTFSRYNENPTKRNKHFIHLTLIPVIFSIFLFCGIILYFILSLFYYLIF